MRGFIKFCGGLFVVIGILGFILAAVAVMFTIRESSFGLAAGLSIILASAGVTLIGGTAYMLCSIDERLEQFRTPSPKAAAESATMNAPAVHSPEWE